MKNEFQYKANQQRSNFGDSKVKQFLVPGSSGVEGALGDTNPPASPVLRCLLYLVPSDPYLLEILADDTPPILTWASMPSPETIWFPMVSLTWDPVTFHA